MHEHPPGVIALPVGDLARYSRFLIHMLALEMPPGSATKMATGMDVTLSLNTIVKDAIEDANVGWVWFNGDDHTFDPDALMRLLDHEVDIVVPLITRRQPPYNLVIYRETFLDETDDGLLTTHYRPFSIADIPTEGLFEVMAAGSGGMLVRRHVLEEIGFPWFENSHGSYVNDDLEFCRKMRDAGYTIRCDPSVVLGHIANYVVRPEVREGRWGLSLDFGGGGKGNVIWLGGDPQMIAEEQARIAEEMALA